MKYTKTISFFLTLVLIHVSVSFGQQNYWQQKVDNEIYVKLLPDQKRIQGHQSIHYFNNSPDSLSEIYFHLYPNAYTDTSILFSEVDNYLVPVPRSKEAYGWIQVDSVRMEMPGQSVRIDSVTRLHDGTILKLSFIPAILPGHQATIQLKFESKLRKYSYNKGKGGYRGDQFEFCHWYPKVCVYDQNGWNAVPTHWLGEFYGEFGTFDVTINVPASYVVAATGELVNQESKIEIASNQADSNILLASTNDVPNFEDVYVPDRIQKSELTYHAENIHNFTWVCNPNFLKESDTWRNIKIDVCYRKKSREVWGNKVMADVKLILSWLTDFFGEFPYPKITVCEQIFCDGGMEYPMIVLVNPPTTNLVLHEIAHQYFYGAVANNEFTEGWLDEGIVTYQTLKFLEYNKKSTRPLQTKNKTYRLLRKQFAEYNVHENVYLNSLYNYYYSGFEKPMSYPCYRLNNLYLYTFHVYTKPTKFFELLEYTVGRETFDRMIQEYYREWKFKHVNAQRLQSVCERVSGMDLDWLFHQWLHTTNHVDYACSDMTSRKNAEDKWETTIEVSRLGAGMSPIEAEITTASGEKHRKKWLGTEKIKKVTFVTSSKAKQVQLDPEDRILDINRLNNSKFKMEPFIYHDFYSMYQLPRNAYSLFLWPRAWFNELDGVKLGLKVYGSYLNRYYVTRNQFWYNLKSRTLDFNLGYSMPWESIDNKLWRHLYIKNTEGRREINANINYNVTKKFNGIPEQVYRFGFLHLKATDRRYTSRTFSVDDKNIDVQTWDAGKINQLYFDFSKRSLLKPALNHEISMEISRPELGSDYNYFRITYENEFRSLRYRKAWQLIVRNFAGAIFGSEQELPVHRRFWIGEGNPVDRFNYYYLRSPGSLPGWLNYHFPGDGKLRGYANSLVQGAYPLTGKRMISSNIELVCPKPTSLFPKNIRKFLGTIQLAMFLDAGCAQIQHLDTRVMMDAGLSIQIHKQLLDQRRVIRFDFPFWLSQPVLDEFSPHQPQWKFRWSVSVQ